MAETTVTDALAETLRGFESVGNSGEQLTTQDLAESLDVSPPTFHQHLRKAERKVFESLLSDGKRVAGGD
jgi:DNA-binding CsgD family transcriptional regulator